jgi:hypothetical protein
MIEAAEERYAAREDPQQALEEVAEDILGLAQDQLRRALDEVQELRDNQVRIVLLRARNRSLRVALFVCAGYAALVTVSFLWWLTTT